MSYAHCDDSLVLLSLLFKLAKTSYLIRLCHPKGSSEFDFVIWLSFKGNNCCSLYIVTLSILVKCMPFDGPDHLIVSGLEHITLT